MTILDKILGFICPYFYSTHIVERTYKTTRPLVLRVQGFMMNVGCYIKLSKLSPTNQRNEQQSPLETRGPCEIKKACEKYIQQALS
jgi:hypothetical protein